METIAVDVDITHNVVLAASVWGKLRFLESMGWTVLLAGAFLRYILAHLAGRRPSHRAIGFEGLRSVVLLGEPGRVLAI